MVAPVFPQTSQRIRMGPNAPLPKLCQYVRGKSCKACCVATACCNCYLTRYQQRQRHNLTVPNSGQTGRQ